MWSPETERKRRPCCKLNEVCVWGGAGRTMEMIAGVIGGCSSLSSSLNVTRLKWARVWTSFGGISRRGAVEF